MGADKPDQPRNKSARRRLAKEQQRAQLRAARRGHSAPPALVLTELEREAAPIGIEGLIQLTDDQLAELPDGMVDRARWHLTQRTPMTTQDAEELTLMVVMTCTIWADHVDGDDDAKFAARDDMISRCGLVREVVGNQEQYGAIVGGPFGTAAMLISNRLALVGDTTLGPSDRCPGAQPLWLCSRVEPPIGDA